MKKILYIFIPVLFVLFTVVGCKTGNDTRNKEVLALTEATPTGTESEILVDFIEKAGNYINRAEAPGLIPATEVNANLKNYLVIDLRDSLAYQSGHIPGSVNVGMDKILSYLESKVYAPAYPKIVLVCNSGQTAAYTTSLLRLIGYGNVYALKYGLSSWSEDIAESFWKAKVNNNFASKIETKGNSKAAKGKLPEIKTGETSGYAIARKRVEEILAKGFTGVTIKPEELFEKTSEYYVVNYWPMNEYVIAHVPGAVQYQPKKSLIRSEELLTLPTSRKIVVYCYTGQNSAYVVAYLNALGYDALSLSYGANGFMHGLMKQNEELGHAFDATAEINNFELIEGNDPWPFVENSAESTNAEIMTETGVVNEKKTPEKKSKKASGAVSGGC